MIHRILITGSLHPQIIEKFKANQEFDITYIPDAPRQELLEKIPDAHILVTRSETKVDREVLEKGENLKLVARAAVGVGNIDIDLATEKGVLVINTPGKNTNSAAEMTFALALSFFRNIHQANQSMKEGHWNRHAFTGHEMRGKRMGIVGLGNVGHRVALFAKAFEMELLGYDPYISPERFQKYKVKSYSNLDEMLPELDFLSVHVPLNKETSGMIAAPQLAKLRPHCIVLNAARGGIITEEDLLSALEDKKIGGYACDTWVGEPDVNEKLVKHERVLPTPHIGASTIEAQLAIGQTVYEQIGKFIASGVVDSPVNLPGVGMDQTSASDKKMRSYTVLSEKLGSLCGQILRFNPTKFEIMYRGDIANNASVITQLAFMKGYLSEVKDRYISYVNAPHIVDEMGIKVEERHENELTSYKSALKILIYGQNDQILTLGGTVFEDDKIRLTLLDDFYFENDASGNFIYIKNNDEPGVVGEIGMFLAKKNINIDSFSLSRNRKGGNAMALIKVDSILKKSNLNELASIKNITKADQFIL